MSYVREKNWEDIGEACLFFALGLPRAAYENVQRRLARLANAQPPGAPAQARWRRPLAAAAGAAHSFQEKLTNVVSLALGFFTGAHLTAVAAGIGAAAAVMPALHASWSGLVAGHGILAGLGAVGAGFAAYSAVGAACFVGLGIVLPALAGGIGGLGKIVSAARAGWKETKDWRREQAAPKPAVAPAPFTYVPPAPSGLIRDLGWKLDTLERAGSAERVRFLKDLRRKFPADFADAMRSGLNAPVLRKDVTAMKKLKFKRKGVLQRMTGSAP